MTGTLELHAAARQAYRESVAAGEPLSAATLGERFRRSERWGRERIAEVRAEPLTDRFEPEPFSSESVDGGEVRQPEPPAATAETIIEPAAIPARAAADPGTSLRSLQRIRWAVRAVLLLGVAASVTGNVLHAWDNPISQAIAAWPPLALLLTVELTSRVPVHRRSLAYARMATTAVIAGIAAWVSYWHLVDVAIRYGETDASPYLLPLSIDGLIVVASICLVELGGRIRGEEQR